MQYVEELNSETARLSRVSTLAAEASWIMRVKKKGGTPATYRESFAMVMALMCVEGTLVALICSHSP